MTRSEASAYLIDFDNAVRALRYAQTHEEALARASTVSQMTATVVLAVDALNGITPPTAPAVGMAENPRRP